METIGKTQLTVVNSRVRQFFQKYYEFGVIRAHLRKHRIDLTGKVILDAGCGSGYSTEVILRRFRPAKMVAFDLLPDQVELVRRRQMPVQVFVGDVADIQLEAEMFDAVFTFGVFHHVLQWPRALREVHRVLKPGGVLVGGEMNCEPEIGFEWAGFAQDLEQAGFSMLECQDIYMGLFKSFLCAKTA